jgi:hypothetical protein
MKPCVGGYRYDRGDRSDAGQNPRCAFDRRLGQRTGQDCEDKGDCAKDEKIADKRSVIGGAEDRLDRQLHAYPEKTCPSRTNGARSQSFPENRSPASSLTRFGRHSDSDGGAENAVN